MEFDCSRRAALAQLAVLTAACVSGDEEPERVRVHVAPSSSATTQIQQALDAGAIVFLLPGTYILSQPLVLRSGARLIGSGSSITRLLAGFSPPVEGADDRDNALLHVTGEPVADAATTLSASAPKDSWYLSLAAPLPDLVAGDWVRVSGPNLVEDEYEMSDAAPLCELLPVASVDASMLGLDAHTMQFHGVGVAVDAVEPAVDVEVSGFDISAEGGSVAVGVALTLAVDVRLSDLSGAGFSRALVDLGPGSRGVRIREIRSRGEVNSIVYGASAMDVHIETILTTPTGERCHALGVPRALVNFVHRCTSIVTTSGILENGCLGIRTYGGHHLSFSDLLIRNMEPSAAIERDSLIQGYTVGVGIDSGAGWLDYAEFARDISYVNVHLEDCRQPMILQQAAWYLHDIWGVTVTGCSVVNKGWDPSTPGAYMTGILASDCSGSIDSIMLQGVNHAFRSRNVTTDLFIGHLDIFGSAGEGVAGAGGLMLDHGVEDGGRGPQVGTLKLNNVSYYFHAGWDFEQHPDWEFSIAKFYADGFEASNCVVGYSIEATPFSMGEVAEIATSSPGPARHLVTPTGPSTRNVIIASGRPHSHGTRYLLAATAPLDRTHVLCATGPVAVGDLLVASVSHPRRAEVDNAPENPFVVLGKAMTSKPEGQEGLVLVGPA